MILILSIALLQIVPLVCPNDVPNIPNSILNDVISDDVVNPRHHKVHNLILNPDQHSWCELKKIRQIVTHALCESQEMENFVCVGACFSYSVPQTEPEIPGDEMLDYCDSCQPSESHWTTVTLDCEEHGAFYTVTKNIQRITNCSCATCRPTRKSTTNNDVMDSSELRISELNRKKVPIKRNQAEENVIDDQMYSQVSLGDLKMEMNLDQSQINRLSGKVLMKDTASFTDSEDDTSPDRAFLTN